MRAWAILALTTVAALICACQPRADKPRFNTARAVDAIRTGEVHWNADWKSGDPAAVAAHYAPGATVMIPGASAMIGIDAIRAGAQKNMNDGAFALTFGSDQVEVSAAGDLAVSRGAFTETFTDPATKTPITVAGTFVTVYKPQPDRTWKAVWDIATPGTGPAAAAPPAK